MCERKMTETEAWKEQNLKSRLSKISKRMENMARWKLETNLVQGPRNPTNYFQKWGSAQRCPKTDFMRIWFENWESLVTFMTKKKKKINFSVKSSQTSFYHSGGYTPSLDFIIYHYVFYYTLWHYTGTICSPVHFPTRQRTENLKDRYF